MGVHRKIEKGKSKGASPMYEASDGCPWPYQGVLGTPQHLCANRLGKGRYPARVEVGGHTLSLCQSHTAIREKAGGLDSAQAGPSASALLALTVCSMKASPGTVLSFPAAALEAPHSHDLGVNLGTGLFRIPHDPNR